MDRTTIYSCARCAGLVEPGEGLRVSPTDGGPSFVIHRPDVSSFCLDAAGTRDAATIALLDPEAARRRDRAVGPGEHPGNRRAARQAADPRFIPRSRPR